MTSKLSSFRKLHLALILSVVAGLGAGGWFAFARGKSGANGSDHSDEHARPAPSVTVEVVSPRAGGIDRVCVQPGTVEPFESADLYAKASGFLVEQKVDIGSRVTRGDLLARISVPEYEKQVQRDRARVKAAEAKVRQMEAHVVAAESEAKAADASVKRAKSLVLAKTAYRKYREKQLARYNELAARQAIEQRVVDEQEDYFLSAQEGENEAKEAVNAATEKAATARARIDQAKADLEQANSEVGVAMADLERSQVLLDYTVVKAPYTGIVTRRSFHIGDFVKSADQGGATSLLSVERTDVMRVVVQVPDRDVPYVSLGDPAVVEIDALPGAVFKTGTAGPVAVSRWSDAEDPTTRTMRTEIDVKNPDDQLRHGMYGRVTLTLQKGSPTAVRIPTPSITSRAPGGKGTVRLVRGEKIETVQVVLGADNGVEVEILSGLTAGDRVVVRTSGPVTDGATVSVAGAKSEPAAAH
jgi:RND family efflux transporter MFP subunit